MNIKLRFKALSLMLALKFGRFVERKVTTENASVTRDTPVDLTDLRKAIKTAQDALVETKAMIAGV